MKYGAKYLAISRKIFNFTAGKKIDAPMGTKLT